MCKSNSLTSKSSRSNTDLCSCMYDDETMHCGRKTNMMGLQYGTNKFVAYWRIVAKPVQFAVYSLQMRNECSTQKKKKLMRNDCDADAWETGTEHMKFHWSGTTAASCRDWEPEVHISQWCASSPKKSFFIAMLAGVSLGGRVASRSLPQRAHGKRLPRSLLHARRLSVRCALFTYSGSFASD